MKSPRSYVFIVWTLVIFIIGPLAVIIHDIFASDANDIFYRLSLFVVLITILYSILYSFPAMIILVAIASFLEKLKMKIFIKRVLIYCIGLVIMYFLFYSFEENPFGNLMIIYSISTVLAAILVLIPFEKIKKILRDDYLHL